MKKLIIPFLAGVLLSCAHSTAQDTKFSEKIHKEFTVSPNTFMAVYNLEGSVKIEGYAGDKIIIDVDKTIRADNNRDLEEGKRDFKLSFDQNRDSVIIYTAAPYDTRPKTKGCNCNVDVDYQVHLNYIIKVPNSLNMRISTINDGDIYVENVNGLMRVNNINGGITLKNVKGANDVHTINGNISINYIALPPDDAKYYTLNGDLTVIYPANFSADCEFKSFHGELYTDFEEIEKLPSQVSKITKESNGSTSSHKITRTDVIRIGKGGKKLHFETFNGNIYIKKKS